MQAAVVPRMHPPSAISVPQLLPGFLQLPCDPKSGYSTSKEEEKTENSLSEIPKTVQQVKVLADKPKDPSSIPRSNKLEGKNKLPQAVL